MAAIGPSHLGKQRAGYALMKISELADWMTRGGDARIVLKAAVDAFPEGVTPPG